MYNGGNFTLRDRWPGGFFSSLSSRIVGLFSSGEKRYMAPDGFVSAHSGGETRSFTTETALKVTAVLAAVRAISQGCAQVEKTFVSREYDRKLDRFSYKRDLRNPFWSLLVERPNDWQTPFEFYEAMTACAVLRGNAYALLNDIVPTRPELIQLPSHSVTVIALPSGETVYEITEEGGGKRQVKRNKIVHLKGPQLGGLIASDVLAYAAGAIGLAEAAENAHTTILARRGRVDGILSSEVHLTDASLANRVSRELERVFGRGSRGGVAFLDQGVKFARITDSADAMQLIEHRQFQISEIGRAFGVQDLVLNQSLSGNSYGAAEQVWQAHATHCLDPWYDRWEDALKMIIGNDGNNKDRYIRFNREQLKLVSAKDTAEAYRTYYTIGAVTPNEIRVERGYNPLSSPGADEPQTQMNMRSGFIPEETQEGQTDDQQETDSNGEPQGTEVPPEPV